MRNYFEIFCLPPRFRLDTQALSDAYYRVQNKCHPDRFSSASMQEKKITMQWASRVNEAYQTLRDPLKRARYLCELNGIECQSNPGIVVPPEFLEQQMNWHETLEDVMSKNDRNALEEIEAELSMASESILGNAEALLDSEDFSQASLYVRQLMFLERFREEISKAFVMLDS